MSPSPTSGPPILVIAGTGTEIGKTHTSVALLDALARRGYQARGIKPIETGYDAPRSDAARLARGGTLQCPLYTFVPPVSPHLAARMAGVPIDLPAIRRWVQSHATAELDLLLVETAGGLFTPINGALTNLDLIRALEPCHWILVAPNRLGVLHDVTATVTAARWLHRAPDALLLNAAGSDASTPSNADELRHLAVVPQVFTFSRHPEGAWVSHVASWLQP